MLRNDPPRRCRCSTVSRRRGGRLGEEDKEGIVTPEEEAAALQLLAGATRPNAEVEEVVVVGEAARGGGDGLEEGG